MRARGLVCGLASISLLGCQTARSWEEGCPGVYSGVRYYGEQLGVLLPVSVFMKPKRPKYGCLPGMHLGREALKHLCATAQPKFRGRGSPQV